MVVVERAGEEEFRPGVVDKLVDCNVFRRIVASGNALNDALRFLTALRRIEDNELAFARHAVVSGDNTDEFRGLARNVFRIERAVRPERAASVMFDLIRAVRIHGKDVARIVVRNIYVFPPQVHNAPVGQDRRIPVVVLLERQLPDRLAVLFNAVEVADEPGAPDARDAHHGGGGYENRRAVGNVASFDVVDVAAHVRRNLAQFSVFKSAFEDLPRAVFRESGNEAAIGVPVERNIADIGSARALNDLFHGRGQIVHIEKHERVVVLPLAARRVGDPVRLERRIVRLAQ